MDITRTVHTSGVAQMLQSIKELPIGESITLYDVIVKLPSGETVSLGATFTLR